MTAGERQFAKLCELRDFHDPEIADAIREVLREEPLERPRRKAWEFAMVALFLRSQGHLNDDSRVLDVAAGREPLLFWLTNNVGKVTAIDIYGQGHYSDSEAPATMLTDPAQHAPFEFRPDRLDVRYMDARKLEFEDESFDAVVSCSSIEHFGGPEEIASAAREIGRVLRPGGHAFVITELFVKHSLVDRAPVHFAARVLTGGRRAGTATLRRRHGLDEMFTPRELQRDVIGPSGLRLMQDVDMSISPDTWDNVTVITPDAYLPSSGNPYPSILLKAGRSVFTSVTLPLEKPA